VVIPVYNTERYVGATLESVVAQSYRNLEIIVVIDGSTDGSLDICRSFHDPRIRIVEQENQGLAGARNTGIREAAGEYIGFIDSDDTWAPKKVERHVEHFAANPDLGVSFSYSALMDEHTRSLGSYQKEGTDPAGFSDFFVRNVVGNGSNAMLRKAVFEGRASDPDAYPVMDGFLPELRRAEDYELWSRIIHKTRWKMACIPEPLVNYRMNPGGLSANIHMQRKYHFLAMAHIAGYAQDEAEKWRRSAVAHTYWHQARTAANQHAPRIGTNAVKLALWYDWRSITMNHLMICLAVIAALVLPERPYYALQRWAGRAWGRAQRLQMRLSPRPKTRVNSNECIPPARTFVKKPEAYVRKKAMPNLFFLCHKHRFMYLAISKNASTSMKFLMWQEEHGGKSIEEPSGIHRYWGFHQSPGRAIDRRDREGLAGYSNYLKFAVYRDPVSRFLSAYHNRVLFTNFAHPFYSGKRLSGMGLDQFIRVTESILKIENPLHIDEHLRPQAWCYEPAEVDFIVPIDQLQLFLKQQFGIDLNRSANRTDLPGIKATAEQLERIRNLYRCDYAIEPNWWPSGNHQDGKLLR
jgi:glycosyltransferase involved in cell wall biosynthesis